MYDILFDYISSEICHFLRSHLQISWTGAQNFWDNEIYPYLEPGNSEKMKKSQSWSQKFWKNLPSSAHWAPNKTKPKYSKQKEGLPTVTSGQWGDGQSAPIKPANQAPPHRLYFTWNKRSESIIRICKETFISTEVLNIGQLICNHLIGNSKAS